MIIKELFIWSWNHKWWFVISVACCLGIGMFYFLTATPTRDVSASIMLRTTDAQSQQGEMMSLMGVDGSKMATDEIEVLKSRDLMEQIVDSFHLTMTVERREHLRWIPVFPCPEFALAYDQPVLEKTVYRMKEGDERYRITVYPRMNMVDSYIRRIDVSRLTRESQVIILSMNTPNPEQAVAILDMLINLYNDASAKDRNAIALQSQVFLENHFNDVQKELTEAEIALETYKSENQITNVDATSAEYHALIENYERQLANIDFNLRVMDNLELQLNDSLIQLNQSMIYGDFRDASINNIVSLFNKYVFQRIDLLESATENNPKVKALDQVMDQQRYNIAKGCNETRVALKMEKDYISALHNKYSTALALMPEHERSYMEMKRQMKTLEEQYLYLVRKREENTLILVSSSLSAKVVDRAKMSARISSPNLMKTGVVSVFFGLLIPLFVFFGGIIKRKLQ